MLYEVYCHIHYLDLWRLDMCFAIYIWNKIKWTYVWSGKCCLLHIQNWSENYCLPSKNLSGKCCLPSKNDLICWPSSIYCQKAPSRTFTAWIFEGCVCCETCFTISIWIVINQVNVFVKMLEYMKQLLYVIVIYPTTFLPKEHIDFHCF